MTANRNPFAHLIPIVNSGIVGLNDDEADKEAEAWRKKGELASKNLNVGNVLAPAVGNPSKVSSAPVVNSNPFDHLIPKKEKNPQELPQAMIENTNLPIPVKSVLQYLLSNQRPMKETVPERLEAIKRGGLDIGEGLKQLYLSGKEGFDKVPGGATDRYTKQVESERKAYERTAGAQDPVAKATRELTKSLPYLAVGGPLLGGGRSLLAKIFGGALAGGGLGATEFVPEYGSRASNVAQGALIAGGIPLALEVPGAVATGTKKAINAIKSPFTSLKPLEENLAKAEQEALSASEAYEKAASESKQATKMKDTDLMKYKSEENKSILNQPKESVETLPIPSSKESGEKLQNIIESHEQAKKSVSDIEDEINRHLNEGAAHPIHIASDLNKKMDIIENHFSDSYKNLMRNLESSKFQMPEKVINEYDVNLEKIKEAARNKNYAELVRLGKNPEQEMSSSLKYIMDKAPTSKDVNAHDFMAKYKDFRDARYELSQKMKDKDVSSLEKLEIKRALKDSKEMESTIKDALYKGLGEHAPEFERINKGYSELVFPLRSYKLAKKVREGQNLPKNFIEALSGKSAYKRTENAQKAMRELVKSDPETLRNLIGQRYAGKIEKLHKPDELTREYLEKMPKLNKMISSHKEAIENVPVIEKQLSKAKAEHEKVLSQESKAQKIVDEKQKKIEEQRLRHEKISKETEELDKHIAKLEEEEKKKNISLSEKVKLNKQLKDARNKRKQNRIILGGIAGAIGLKPALGFISKIFTGND